MIGAVLVQCLGAEFGAAAVSGVTSKPLSGFVLVHKFRCGTLATGFRCSMRVKFAGWRLDCIRESADGLKPQCPGNRAQTVTAGRLSLS